MSVDLEKELEEDSKRIAISDYETKNRVGVTERDIEFYKKIAWSLVIVGGIILVVSTCFFRDVTTATSIWNLYGDFVGGVVSSLWSLAGLLFIYLAFLGQKQQLLVQQLELKYSQIEVKATRLELSGQKEQMRIQNQTLMRQGFENTFFQLLQSQNEIIKLMDLKGSSITTGRDCFKVFYHAFERKHQKKRAEVAGNTQLTRENLELHEVEEVYMKVFELYESDLGHYFRHLYHIFRFVDEAEIKDKQKYARFIRAQLSSYELVFIFFNGFSSNGKKKFKRLIEEYQVLKNMNFALLLDETNYKKAYHRSAYGE